MHCQSATLQPGALSRLVLVEPSDGAAAGVIVAGHHERRFRAARQIPETRQRLARAIEVQHEIREQALLFVRLRNRDLVQIDPVRQSAVGAEEQIVRTDRRDAVALLSRPRRISLARVDDGAREVEGECGRLTSMGADRGDRHRRARRRGRRVAEERGDRGRAGGHVAICGAVELIVSDTMPAPGADAVSICRYALASVDD